MALSQSGKRDLQHTALHIQKPQWLLFSLWSIFQDTEDNSLHYNQAERFPMGMIHTFPGHLESRFQAYTDPCIHPCSCCACTQSMFQWGTSYIPVVPPDSDKTRSSSSHKPCAPESKRSPPGNSHTCDPLTQSPVCRIRMLCRSPVTCCLIEPVQTQRKPDKEVLGPMLFSIGWSLVPRC